MTMPQIALVPDINGGGQGAGVMRVGTKPMNTVRTRIAMCA